MANNTSHAAFDPKAFLAIMGEGKTILEFPKDQVVFAQGDAADTVFYSNCPGLGLTKSLD